jgi:penicillin-binding protein 1C
MAERDGWRLSARRGPPHGAMETREKSDDRGRLLRRRPDSTVRTALAGVLLLVAVLFGTVMTLDRWLPPPSAQGLAYSDEVLGREGERLRLYTTSDGFWRLPVGEVMLDKRFLAMLLAYEDKRFYSHGGVDLLALGRALGQSLAEGRFVSGASTLTMQTARLLEPRERTLRTKLTEMVRAWQLERRLDKEAILRLYLDLAPYGGNLQGVRAASLLYFGKEPERLSTAESALLVALPQSPETRRPDRFPEQAREARDAVLERMVGAGVIGRAEADSAQARPVPDGRRPAPFLAPQLADAARRLAPRSRAQRTTLDTGLQKRVETCLRAEQSRLAPGLTLAALVVENPSVEVRVYAGSGDYFGKGFPGQVDMVQAVRSPGSALKPFIYGLGFDEGGIHPQTLIVDRPGPVHGYAPANFDGQYLGEMRVRDALATSRNLPAVQVLDRVGPVRFTGRLQGSGVRLRLPDEVERPGLPIALGGVGVTLQDLVTLYAAVANGGRTKPLRILQDQPPQTSVRLLSPASAWYLTEILAGSPLPAGHRRRADPVAFKTGTSYGFRDAWAIGFGVDYTVGVWVGRPDGGYTAGLSGRTAAVPVMLEVFDLLGAKGVHALLQQRPPGVLRASNSELPPALRRFDHVARRGGLLSGPDRAGPSIEYPPEGSLVELAHDDTVLLEARGGVLPYHWLLDGRYTVTTEYDRRFAWPAPREGPVNVSVVDAHGRSARVSFSVRLAGEP